MLNGLLTSSDPSLNGNTQFTTVPLTLLTYQACLTYSHLNTKILLIVTTIYLQVFLSFKNKMNIFFRIFLNRF